VKRQRYVEQFELPGYDAGVLSAERSVAEYFEALVDLHAQPKICSNWVMGEVMRALNDNEGTITDCPVSPELLAGLLKRIDDNTISNKIAKTVFEEIWQTGKSADQVIEEKGLKQVSDTGAIEAILNEVIAANIGQFEELKAGKDKLTGFFVGQVMKLSKGKANPGMVNQLIQKKLSE
jgi:aspartyl-tRNA(Asn)/glutamyl-tRNA(Gln) amidotransferase subunit B